MGFLAGSAAGALPVPRVMLIEDDEAVAETLKQSIERAGMPASWASTGADAIAMKPEFRPDVVLVDLELPDTSGIVLIKWLVEQRDCGVIVVSGIGDVADRVIGLELGADDYVAKPPNLRELIARIRAVHRRSSARMPNEPEAAQAGPVTAGGVRLDRARRAVHGADGERIALTSAEYGVLDQLFGAQGKVVSRDEISQAVLNRPWRPEDRSVDQLILNLRQKLALDADGQSPIQSIRGSGYLLRLA